MENETKETISDEDFAIMIIFAGFFKDLIVREEIDKEREACHNGKNEQS